MSETSKERVDFHFAGKGIKSHLIVDAGTAERHVDPALILSVTQVGEERTVKLARSAMRSHAARVVREQNGLCPLCCKPIDLGIKGEGVLDHDHDSGRIRGVLHRSCNAAEGKISNAAARWGAKSAKYADIVPYLEALVTYLKKPSSRFIYPMHRTPDEKKDAARAKAAEARAALKAKRLLAQQRRKEGTNA